MKWKEKPELRTVDILVWLYRERGGRFTIRDIVQEFGILRQDARRRVVAYMIGDWEAAREIGRRPAHRRGRREVEYALTAWGETFAARRMKAERRVAANPKKR